MGFSLFMLPDTSYTLYSRIKCVNHVFSNIIDNMEIFAIRNHCVNPGTEAHLVVGFV